MKTDNLSGSLSLVRTPLLVEITSLIPKISGEG